MANFAIVVWSVCISLRLHASQCSAANDKAAFDDSSPEGHYVSLLQVKQQRRLAPATGSSAYSWSSSNASSSSSFNGPNRKESVPSSLHLADTLRLHPGKTGGTTVAHLLHQWNIGMGDACHPEPCRDKFQYFPQALISVRDPIDTFESAFNWRAWILCSAENEKRQVSASAAGAPFKFCEDDSTNPGEAAILQKKYAFNSTKLAEAMCDEGGDGEEARQDWGKIQHAKWPLIDWLSGAGRLGIRLGVMVLEPGFDFEDQIFSVTRWAVQNSLGDDAANDMRARRKNVIEQPAPGKRGKMLHSSRQSPYHTSPLSRLGQCCMARQLATSYELISNLATGGGCRGDRANVCKAALMSIYSRRQVFLNSSMSCQELVSDRKSVV